MEETERGARVRIDKWLWAARFYKTRSLAAQAVESGKARANGERVKPAREVKKGDRLTVAIGEYQWHIEVLELSTLRRGAPEAQRLYRESEESRAAREAQAERRKIAMAPFRDEGGRPTKRDRRMIRRFTDE